MNPDNKPGFYYVSMRDAKRTALLVGPFKDNHARALECVDPARREASDLRPEYHFCSYGTVRFDADQGHGILNASFPDWSPEQ
jgi:hypothetical protein